jgi:lysophospholipase L1-like esterase
MKKLTAVIASAVFALAACGGGSGSSVPAQLSPITSANAGPSSVDNAKVKIQMFGDSTTAGAQTMNGRLYTTALNEPSMVQTFLRQWFNRTDIVVDNQGVGGTEASQLLNGTDGVHNVPFDTIMANSDAQIVMFNFALNDNFYYAAPQPGKQAESPNDYWGIMANLCQIARNHGKVCVFQEPNPINGVVQGQSGGIGGYVYTLRQVAAQMNAPLVKQWDSYFTIPGWLGTISEDGVHPKDEGYAWKANNTASALIPIVSPFLQ